MKIKTYYLVGAVERTKGLDSEGHILPIKNTIELVWADGMVGACPVFSNRRKAEKYADKKYPVMTFKAEVAK